MQRKLINLLILPICCLLTGIAAAADQSIHIEWGYTPPNKPAVVGYRLYQEGTAACETQNPSATSMDCVVSLIQDTTNFTLTALFDDESESPHSRPFSFTVASEPDPPITSEGSHAFTFQWDLATTTDSISKYNIYLNNTLLCQSVSPTATTLTCNTDLLDVPMQFSMTTVDTSGIESLHSNLLSFDPILYPDTGSLAAVLAATTTSGEAPLTVGFDATSSTGDIISYSWLFGDGSTATGATASHIYNSAGTFPATLTVTDSTGATSNDTVTITVSDPPVVNSPPTAVISASSTSGEAPLAITFSAASSSDPDDGIAGYSWNFGDGSTATGVDVSHIYSAAGSFTATLTVTDKTGATSNDMVVITVSDPPAENTPPTAVLSSSSTSGEAPLAITFSAASSSDPDDGIAGYSWNFGDGSTATGVDVSHTYSSAGTFTATLTVTDTLGLSDSVSTPIVISEPVETNNPPTAVLTATPTTGTYPLTVTFSASGSADSDGSITSYLWNFGDGSTATGSTASHTYTTEANLVASLTVTDDMGDTGSASTTITVTAPVEEPTVPIEIGEVTVNSNWTRVQLTSSFKEPIVIAGPPSFNDPDPGVIRLRNINSTGFDIKFSEWDYLDGTHGDETVSYLVIEKGNHIVNGIAIEAGTITGTNRFSTYSYTKPFIDVPVVLTTIASNNGQNTIGGRLKKVTPTTFEYYFREQESSNAKHTEETVNYIAWQQGNGSMGSLAFEAALTGDIVTHNWTTVQLNNTQSIMPFLLADMQTNDVRDSSATRVQNVQTGSFLLKIEEEQSKDDEVEHTTEVVGYLSLSANTGTETSVTKLVTLTWDFDSAQESTISGFRIYNNRVLTCEAPTPSVRSITCEASLQSTNSFNITAVQLSGDESNLSNTIQVNL